MKQGLYRCSLERANSIWVVCSFSAELPSKNDVSFAGTWAIYTFLQGGFPAPVCPLFSRRFSFIFHREACLPRIHPLPLLGVNIFLSLATWWAEPADCSVMLCSSHLVSSMVCQCTAVWCFTVHTQCPQRWASRLQCDEMFMLSVPNTVSAAISLAYLRIQSLFMQ